MRNGMGLNHALRPSWRPQTDVWLRHSNTSWCQEACVVHGSTRLCFWQFWLLSFSRFLSCSCHCITLYWMHQGLPTDCSKALCQRVKRVKLRACSTLWKSSLNHFRTPFWVCPWKMQPIVAMFYTFFFSFFSRLFFFALCPMHFCFFSLLLVVLVLFHVCRWQIWNLHASQPTQIICNLDVDYSTRKLILKIP